MSENLDFFVDGKKKFDQIRSEIVGVSFDSNISASRHKRRISAILKKLKKAIKENKKTISVYYSVSRVLYEPDTGELTLSMESRYETFERNDKRTKK